MKVIKPTGVPSSSRGCSKHRKYAGGCKDCNKANVAYQHYEFSIESLGHEGNESCAICAYTRLKYGLR